MSMGIAALRLAGKHWRLIVAGVLLALLILQSWRLVIEQRRHANTRTAAAEQIADVRAATLRAITLAHAEKARKEAENEKARRASADAFAALSDRYRAALLQRTSRSDPRRAGTADLPGPADPAGFPAEPAGGAVVPFGMMMIKTDDALICADNTAYAQAAHQWAIGIGSEPAERPDQP